MLVVGAQRSIRPDSRCCGRPGASLTASLHAACASSATMTGNTTKTRSVQVLFSRGSINTHRIQWSKQSLSLLADHLHERETRWTSVGQTCALLWSINALMEPRLLATASCTPTGTCIHHFRCPEGLRLYQEPGWSGAIATPHLNVKLVLARGAAATGAAAAPQATA